MMMEMLSLTGEKSSTDADRDISVASSDVNTCDTFQINRYNPNPSLTSTGCINLFSFNPTLTFQLHQHSRNNGFNTPIFNVWRPNYFGISLPLIPSNITKLSRNALIVTRHEGDTALLKDIDFDPIPFEIENVIGGIDLWWPSSFTCKCCYKFRGRVYLANGKTWTLTEDYMEDSYTFQEGDSNEFKYSNNNVRRILWQPPSGPGAEEGKFACKILEPGAYSYGTPSFCATMTKDGIALSETVEEMRKVGSGVIDDQTLILVTGIAVAQYLRWVPE